MQDILVTKNIHRSFGALEVLKGVSLSLQKGETKVIIGPSGTGKSTFLRCINQLTPPDKGEVWLEGIEVTNPKTDIYKIRQQIGMVFQHFNLFNHLSALNNVSVGLHRVKKLEKNEAKRMGLEALDRVGIRDKADSYPAELSGGQQQRVGIARALAMNPKVVLFDEPTSALDPELIGEVLEVMIKVAEEGMTILAVTHEMGFARSCAEEIIFMEKGRILEQGDPEKFFTEPEQERTKEFLHKITELYGNSKEGG